MLPLCSRLSADMWIRKVVPESTIFTGLGDGSGRGSLATYSWVVCLAGPPLSYSYGRPSTSLTLVILVELAAAARFPRMLVGARTSLGKEGVGYYVLGGDLSRCSSRRVGDQVKS